MSVKRNYALYVVDLVEMFVTGGGVFCDTLEVTRVARSSLTGMMYRVPHYVI